MKPSKTTQFQTLIITLIVVLFLIGCTANSEPVPPVQTTPPIMEVTLPTPMPTLTLASSVVEPIAEATPTLTPVQIASSTPSPALTATVIEPTAETAPSPYPYYGVVRVLAEDWPTIAAALGGDIVELLITPGMANADILAALDEAQTLGFRILLHIYDGQSNTQNPWSLVGGQWSISERGAEILQVVEGHPAVWAIYQLHEPFDSSSYHADADAQRALYNLLRRHTNHMLYTDIATLHRPAEAGEVLTDGMCDYCATFPTTWRGEWTSEQCLAETFRRMEADLAVQAERMPNSQLVFLINAYRLGDGSRYRLPTADELRAARGRACDAGVPVLYIPWQHSRYNETLSTTPELWPVVAEGCNPQDPPSVSWLLSKITLPCWPTWDCTSHWKCSTAISYGNSTWA